MSRTARWIAVVIAVLFMWGLVYMSQGADQSQLREQIKTLKEQQRGEVDRIEKALRDSTEYAKTLWTDLDKAQTDLNKVGVERDGWRDYGNDQHEKFINAEKRVAELKHSTLKWKILFFGLIALIGAFIWFKLSPLGRFSPI